MPPSGQTGWPWTEGSESLPDKMPDGREWPRITVVTPSFNQGRFLEATLRSILLQGYPNLEYFVLDGGSTDSSVEIIKKYERWLTYWVSERDGGQSAAINRGLRMGTGSHATWINSDDMLCQNALNTHVTTHQLAQDVIDIGDCVNIDAAGNFLFTHRSRIETFEQLLRLRSIWLCGTTIHQSAGSAVSAAVGALCWRAERRQSLQHGLRVMGPLAARRRDGAIYGNPIWGIPPPRSAKDSAELRADAVRAGHCRGAARNGEWS